MVRWAAMSSMRRLLDVGRKYCNVAGASAAAAAGRFHPDIGGRVSVIRGGESLIHATGNSSPLPLLMVPPEMVNGYMGDETDTPNTHYNFMRIEKQLVDDNHGGIHKKLFMVEKNKSGDSKLPPVDCICKGASHGWMAFAHPTTRQLGLFNPFGDKVSVKPHYIPLPCCKKYITMLKKMALSCDPSLVGGSECNVVGITESHKPKGLIYCNLGDSAWTNLKGSFQEYSDVVYLSKHGLFYAVPNKYLLEPFNIESWDFTTDPCSPKNTLIQPSHDFIATTVQFPFNPQGWRAKKTLTEEDHQPYSNAILKRYLVEASGDLLLVLRNVATQVDKDGFLIGCPVTDDELRTHITVGFAVYKMDWSENKWESVRSLGDISLFLGINQSFSVSTHDLPQVVANSIYFTDDMDSGFDPWEYSSGYDSGIYNMEDGFISGILPSYLEEIEQLPVWVLPNPN